jgi:hypothetical protein
VEFIETGTGQWPNPEIGGEEEEDLLQNYKCMFSL